MAKQKTSTTTVTLDLIAPNPANPRTITGERAQKLAEYLDEFGDLSGVVHNTRKGFDVLISGHQRMEVFRGGGGDLVITEDFSPPQPDGTIARGYIEMDGKRYQYRRVDWPKEKADRATLVANGTFGEWDADKLSEWGYEPEQLEEMGVWLADDSEEGEGGVPNNALNSEKVEEDDFEAHEIETVQTDIVLGDLFEIGAHRLLCGDSTKVEDVERVMGGALAVCVHADPPYGMGKEADGVLNDNLYGDKLTSFLFDWWKAMRPVLKDNASVYIWGESEPLFSFWYKSGVEKSEPLSLRNEIVWRRGVSAGPFGNGVGADTQRSFFPETEKCLLIFLGHEAYGRTVETWHEGFEPFRTMFLEEMGKAGWSMSDVIALTNSSASHYTSKSQYAFPTKSAWGALSAAANKGAFKQDYEAVKQDYEAVKQEWYSQRAYFDNTHDKMTDVWDFPRVVGSERWGHATPKPVLLVARALKTSSPDGAVIHDPFLGSGTTMVAAHQLNRKCYGLELEPKYCDVIVRRMLKLDNTLTVKRNGVDETDKWLNS